MMEQRFAKTMEAFALPKDATVTVALSGGMDSVTLLHLMKNMKGQQFTLQAAHVNHGLRPEAAEDQAFCRRLCREWQIPLLEFEGDAHLEGLSPEEGARALRYGFLDPLADGERRFVATAHHREDQLETFFINLYRGSGSSGLSGMKPRRGGYLRPLLEMEKDAIIAYAEEHQLPFVTDATNEDTAYLRNFLRHQVLPLLESREEGRFAQGLAAAMQCLAKEEEALSLWAEQAATDDAKALAALPEAVLKRVLDRAYGEPLDRLHFKEIAALLQKEAPSGQVELTKGTYFRLEYGKGLFVTDTEETIVPAVIGGEVSEGSLKFRIHLEEIHSPFTHFGFDCDKINGDPVFRHKRPGDRFLPMGKGGTSRLQKRLKNDRVPRSRRDALWVLADGQDRIVWAEGYGTAKEFCCEEKTTRCGVVEIAEEE